MDQNIILMVSIEVVSLLKAKHHIDCMNDRYERTRVLLNKSLNCFN